MKMIEVVYLKFETENKNKPSESHN